MRKAKVGEMARVFAEQRLRVGVVAKTAGISRTWCGEVKNGNVACSELVAGAIANVLNVPIDQVFEVVS
jgi:DNA-binding XRE family transcriptional regulator